MMLIEVYFILKLIELMDYKHFNKKEEIFLKEGSSVFTSGSGALFKSGIPIGKITNKINVDYFSDFSQLKFVKVIEFKKEEY